MPPFFAGLLPEGARLSGVVSANKTSEDDHFTILLSVGSDTVGDVRVVPSGEAPAPTGATFDSRRPTPDFKSLFDLLTGVGSIDLDSSAIPGVQGKVSAQMFSTPIATTGGPRDPETRTACTVAPPRRERTFFHDCSSALQNPHPDTRIVHDDNGVAGLLVERFDRRHDVGVPQEDACQVADSVCRSEPRFACSTT